MTPREWEVLALVSEGLTNGEIATRLGISESGARFHVSEILSKLGFESRSDAAAWWRTRQGRWSMLPHFTWLATIREAAAAVAVPKIATVLAVPVLIAGAAAAGYGTFHALDSRAGPEPLRVNGAVTSDACASIVTRQCVNEGEDFSTLEEAVAMASFEPSLPTYVPDGFEPVSIRHSRPEFFYTAVESGEFEKGCPRCDPRMSHNDQIGVYFRDAKGTQLVVLQGFPAYMPSHGNAPPGKSGTVRVGESEAVWVEGVPVSGRWDEPQLSLYLELGNVGTGWARLPDGSVMTGSPMSYSITSDDLSLEELVRIAESVSIN